MTWTTTVRTRRKYMTIMVVSFLLMFASAFATYGTWSTYKERITDDNNEPLFHANNTPAYKDEMSWWPTFTGVIFSAAMMVILIISTFINILEWLNCEEPYLFPPKDEKKTLKNIADNYDEEE